MDEVKGYKELSYPGVSLRVLERPISYIVGDYVDSQDIYYQQKLGVHYSRIECLLEDGRLYCEAGVFNASSGDIRFEPLDLGVRSMVTGMVSQNKGDAFFKNKLTGRGMVWLAETLKYLVVVPLKDQKITLEKGLFYAGIGDLHFTISSDINVSNIALNSKKGMLNTVIQGSGYVILEMPVEEDDLVRVPVNQNRPARVDNDLVMFRMGNITRTSRLSTGVIGSMLNSEGVLDNYTGSGYICLAPTLRAQRSIGQYKSHNDPQ